MPYEFQAKATEKFGIEFRSKLESQWAYALNEHNPRLEWEYLDGAWRDFTIKCPWGLMNLEIKPTGFEFALEAATRVPDGEVLFVVQGRPRGGVDGCDLSNTTSCLHRHGDYMYTVSFNGFSFSKWEEMQRFVRGRFGIFGSLITGANFPFKALELELAEMRENPDPDTGAWT